MAVPPRCGHGCLLSRCFLTGIGSSYYHWNPHDGTLFWDRLPMTFSFAALLALIVGERVSGPVGAVLLWPALAVGVFSLLLWRWTDDLRLYFWMQFFRLAMLLFFSSIPPKYTRAYYWIVAMALYAIAKLFEFTDEEIYSAGGLVSGHTLKHLAAAAACFAILRYYQVRQPVAQVSATETAKGPSRIVINSTRTVKGTPSFTKSPKVY